MGFRNVLQITFMLLLPTLAAGNSPAEIYDEFNRFCADTFGVAKETLTTSIPGAELKVFDDGGWQHVSENSACIAWETNLPARAFVEFGETTAYGQKTEASERPFYIHVHYLKGLDVGKTYHYRTVSVDENGKKIESPDQTFATKKIANAVYLPGDLGKPPYELNKGGATYVLTEDIIAPGTGLAINGQNITVDLNGHTVTYNNEAGVKDGGDARTYGALAGEGAQGVRASYGCRGSAKLFNGFITQGKGSGGYGHVPIIFRGAEIAGVTLTYHGPQVSGIDNEVKEVHHCVVNDQGTDLTNRHQGTDAIAISGNSHHNLIKRARHRGINGKDGSKIYRNEIYVDSVATNSFGVMYYKTKSAECTDNRIFGRGYLICGVGTVSEGVSNIKVKRNFIHLQSHAPDARWKEYGEQSGAYCVRVTWGGENLEYADNVLVTKGRDGGMVRGIWYCPGPKIHDVVFRNNTIKALIENDKSDKWGAIVLSGEDWQTTEKSPSPPALFENNTIISNFCHIRLGEQYGAGNNARFVGNTFVREGNLPQYHFVRGGWWKYVSQGNVIVDPKLEGGADLSKVFFEGEQPTAFSVAWTATIKTAPGATITIKDEFGKEETITAGPDGIAKAELIQFTQSNTGKTEHGPYQLTAQANGKSASKELKLTTPTEVEIKL